jgi:O-succinylbenzoate synthase
VSLIEIYRYTIDTTHPKWPKREGIILKKGHCYAEIAPLPGFSKETLEEAIQDLKNHLHFSTLPQTASVQFALSCLDRPFSSVKLNLCALHGNPVHTAKLKLGHLSVEKAIDLVRSYVQKYRLRLDFNKQWSLSNALEFAAAFSKDDFDYLEEPVQTFQELIEFSKQTQFPIAIDESIHLNWNQIPSLKAIVVKPTLLGKIPKVLPHLQLILSSSYESGIGLLHIARLALEMNLTEPMGLDTYTIFQNDFLSTPISCSNGKFSWQREENPINQTKLASLCPIVL